MKKSTVTVLIAAIALGIAGYGLLTKFVFSVASRMDETQRTKTDMAVLNDGLADTSRSIEDLTEDILSRDYDPDEMKSELGKQMAELMIEIQEEELKYEDALNRWIAYEVPALEYSWAREEMLKELDLISNATGKYVSHYQDSTIRMEEIAAKSTGKRGNRHEKARELMRAYGSTFDDHVEAWHETVLFIERIDDGTIEYSDAEAEAIDAHTDRTAEVHSQASDAFLAERERLIRETQRAINSR